ncbi:MAG TPA: MOSC domain-containing protein [Candidatus Sulfotelmatobacter sp.]|jgi:MOSC domain-containing protein YiiM
MNLVSLNIARPQLMIYKGEVISSGIFKKPVSGAVMLRTLNLDGDRQADLSVHGGPFKAVYGYPSEHYEYWQNELPGDDLPWGAFGENFTTVGLSEADLHIGDRFRVGGSILMIRQLRMPCYKLAAKFKRDDMIDLFLHSSRSGFYFSVEQEGEVREGDSIELISRNQPGITIAEMNRVIVHDRYNRDLLQKAINTPELPDSWREYFLPRLNGPPKS